MKKLVYIIPLLVTVMIMGTMTTMMTATTNAFASHSIDPIACEGDGKNNPFSQELFEMCGGDTYYDAFIEGCMSVEGNSREDCESATDAE
jgi:hypothetical protein